MAVLLVVARLDDDKPVSDMRKQRGGEGRGAIGRVGRGRAGLIVLGGVLCVGVLLEGCSGGAKPQSADRGGGAPDTSTVAGPGSAAGETPLPPGSSVDPGRVVEAGPVRVLFIGTSLTAGFGLPDAGQAWPSQLGHIADSLGYQVVIQNAGLSGETSAGALRRTDWLLKDPADVVVIETGANDGLRGTSVPQLEQNLTAIVGKVRARLPKAEVVVVQMEAPPNLGGRVCGGVPCRVSQGGEGDRGDADAVPAGPGGRGGGAEPGGRDPSHGGGGGDRGAECLADDPGGAGPEAGASGRVRRGWGLQGLVRGRYVSWLFTTRTPELRMY